MANLSTNYFIMNKVYIDEGGIELSTMVCPSVREIIISPKVMDNLLVQVEKPWYKYYLDYK